MPIILKNNVDSTLAQAINASETAAIVAAGDGAKFPALGAGDYFYATLVSAQGTREIVKVTSKSIDTLAITRAQEGTTANGFAAGSRVEMRVTAASITDLVDEHDQAAEISIADAGNYYTSTNVEGALQEAAVYNQGSTGAVNRTVDSRLSDYVSVKDFGAVGDGIADDTVAIRAAINSAEASSGLLYIPAGTFLVSSFTVALDSGLFCAFLINGDLTIDGVGTISSATGTVSNAIFGVDGTSGTVNFTLKNITFAGAIRYRVITMTSAAVADSIVIDGIVTERQSIVLGGDYNDRVSVRNCYIGTTIDAATAVSPTLTVVITAGSTRTPQYIIENNTVVGGTENASTGLFVVHGMPGNGVCRSNSALNVGASTTEGFDIDNIGRFCLFDGNYGLNCGFEFKPGTGGYLASSDIIFSNNRTDNGAFALRSSCMAIGNIAYNPPGYGLYMTPGTDSSSLLDDANIIIDNFRILYAGATWTAGVKIDAGFKSISINNLSIELDPEWAVANPAGTLPTVCLNIDGDVNNLRITNSFIDKCAGDQINFRPTTTATNLTLDNIRFGDAGDSCIDLANVDGVTITNPVWPATITDRPIRVSTCSKVRVTTDFKTNIAAIYAAGASTGVLINNLGQEASGAGNRPSVTDIYPVGCIVRNSSDSTYWLRFSESSTPASAWVQVA